MKKEFEILDSSICWRRAWWRILKSLFAAECFHVVDEVVLGAAAGGEFVGVGEGFEGGF